MIYVHYDFERLKGFLPKYAMPEGFEFPKHITSEGFPTHNVRGIPQSQLRQATFRLFFVKLLRIYLHKFCANKKSGKSLCDEDCVDKGVKL